MNLRVLAVSVKLLALVAQVEGIETAEAVVSREVLVIVGSSSTRSESSLWLGKRMDLRLTLVFLLGLNRKEVAVLVGLFSKFGRSSNMSICVSSAMADFFS